MTQTNCEHCWHLTSSSLNEYYNPTIVEMYVCCHCGVTKKEIRQRPEREMHPFTQRKHGIYEPNIYNRWKNG